MFKCDVFNHGIKHTLFSLNKTNLTMSYWKLVLNSIINDKYL